MCSWPEFRELYSLHIVATAKQQKVPKKYPWLTGLQQYVFAIAKSAEEVLLKALMFVARREQDTVKAMLIVEVVISLCMDGIWTYWNYSVGKL